mmetsp:Transcript_15210/g.17692  ORF Transcript_15210/g.17692 Transcript_15210/m.17692 type:complete len:125 (+) Transcript_15210:69-443(+)
MASQDDIIRQETLGILKKKSIQQRFCVLYKDRLDYFTTEESARQKEPPRGHVSLNEVDSVQADDDGFTLKLTSGQSLTLKMSEESKNLWLGVVVPLTLALAWPLSCPLSGPFTKFAPKLFARAC